MKFFFFTFKENMYLCIVIWHIFVTKYISKMKKEDLNFTIYCVGIMAESLGKDSREIYHLMQKGDIIMGYIVPCFDVLHSFSREYIIEDLTNLMQRKGLLPV